MFKGTTETPRMTVTMCRSQQNQLMHPGGAERLYTCEHTLVGAVYAQQTHKLKQ